MLTLNEIKEKWKKEVQKVLYFDDNNTIVLCRFNVTDPDPLNVFCLDRNGNIRWVIFPDELWPNDYYVDISISDSNLIAINVSTIRYTIDIQTGTKIGSIMTK